MGLFRDDAIVLRRLDYSETSQVLLVFCRALGAQRLIARGIKRGTKTRVAVGVDLLESGTVLFSRREGGSAQLGTLTEWRQSDLHDHLRRDLACGYAAQYAAEVTAQLTEEADPHPGLFDALHELLRALEPVPPQSHGNPFSCGIGVPPVIPERAHPQPVKPAPVDPLGPLVVFLMSLLREIGLLPHFGGCVGCGRSIAAAETLYFSSRQGGLLCRDCEPAAVEKRRVDPAAVALLRRVSTEQHSRIAAEPGWRGAFDVLDYHLTETMARPARLSGPLREALRRAGGRKS
jgi:DNA repair protein RecO (recombination protein O)